jgi:hypothetical protein
MLQIEQRHWRFKRRADITRNPEINRRAAPDLFRPDVDLRTPCRPALRIELAVGELGPQHEQDDIIEHGAVARREADQPRAERETSIMGTLASRTA